MTSVALGRRSSTLDRRSSSPEKGGGDQIVDDEDQDRGRDDGVSCRLSDALRSSARIIAVIGAHQCDHKPKYSRLNETRDNIDRLEMLTRSIQISLGVEVQLVDADEIAAKDADDIRDDHQHRHGDNAGEQTRQ